MANKRSRRRPGLVLSLLAAAVIYVGCGSEAKPSASGATMQPEEVTKLYGTKCGICHGADGAMQYAGSKDLSVSKLSREEVVQQIKFGKGTMPPMNNVLDDSAIEKLADYAIALRKTQP